MAVDDPKTIDFVSVNNDVGVALVVISDHLDWIDSFDHQLKLQAKLNAYLAFVESGRAFRKVSGRWWKARRDARCISMSA